jgi:hypothetical protein
VAEGILHVVSALNTSNIPALRFAIGRATLGCPRASHEGGAKIKSWNRDLLAGLDSV